MKEREAGTKKILDYLTPHTPPIRMVSASSVWDQILSGAWSKFYGAANWNWSGEPAKWWRSFVLIDSSSGTPWQNEGTWGDGQLWGDGGNWGSTATPADVLNILGFVRKWKSAGTVVPAVIVTFSSSLFRPQYTADGVHNPNGHFEPQSTGDGTGATTIGTRFGNAAFWGPVT